MAADERYDGPFCMLAAVDNRGDKRLLDDVVDHAHAVERGNRRYRKMHKSVYRVHTHAQITARLALDMWREAQAEGRQQTLAALHHARAG